MKVICKQLKACDFDLKEVTTVMTNDFSYKGWGLEINVEYLVMGMVIYQDTNCVYYLIDVKGRPNWFPYVIFEISDHTLPASWFVKVNGKTNLSDIHTIWGFKELCLNEKFYDQLVEREEKAMMTYFRRKIEREKESGEGL